MKQSTVHQLAAMQSHMGNQSSTIFTIFLMILTYAAIMTLVLKTFQYLKARDFTQYK